MDDPQQAALALTSGGRGILAADERESTMNARLQAAGIAPDPRRRREYREILITTPNLSSAVNAVILSAETVAQPASDGRSFPALLTAAGMTPGVKADLGSRDVLPSGELITTGLDGLDRRLAAARRHGATFAKWRAAFTAGPDLPSSQAVARNVESMVRFAVAARNQGMVPLVEPEILPDRGRDIAVCADVGRIVLSALFECLHGADVDMSHVVLKTGMIMPGSRAAGAARSEIAGMTADVLRHAVPDELSGVVLASGGQDPASATANLHAVCRQQLPWPVTFSFGRALLTPSLVAWRGDPGRVGLAQRILTRRVTCTAGAVRGACVCGRRAWSDRG